MGHRNVTSPIRRLLTPTVSPNPPWALFGPRLSYPAPPRPQTSFQHRPFHATNPCATGSILDLSNLSISRESRFLAKTQGRPRTQFSPHLELIRSSEVEPFTEKETKGEEIIYSHGDGCTYREGMLRDNVSIANTLKELADTRAARESAERRMMELQKKLARREKEAGSLVAVTVLLFLGLVYRDEMRDTMSKTMLGRAWAAVTLQVERDGGGTPNESDDQSSDHNSSVSRDDAVASASGKEHKHRSVVSRLLWASSA